MKPKIENLVIENFRAIKKMELNGLGRVNLITGRNNSGKSTVLEAIRLLASKASLAVIRSILKYREEIIEPIFGNIKPIEADGSFYLTSLFIGFPKFSEKLNSIVIDSSGIDYNMKILIKPTWLPVTEPQKNNDTIQDLVQLRVLIGKRPGLEISINDTPHMVPLTDSIWNSSFDYWSSSGYEKLDEQPMPCLYLSPVGVDIPGIVGQLWDNVALSELEKDVIDALKIIDPKISAISMVGEENSAIGRKAITRAEGMSRPVPLRSFGDGMNRLFQMILMLVNAKGGILLIDEFENGLHYSVQPKAWKLVFELARRLDIQVFATTHSWDAIEAFQEAAAEDPEEGVLVRLYRKDDRIIPTLFREDELAVVTRERIEVR
ncbi:MAG: AAA family ATPase [Deltaproteobacteria bacterium]|nr:AAA family ATPase [Deltaproteobacteria bacterium]